MGVQGVYESYLRVGVACPIVSWLTCSKLKKFYRVIIFGVSSPVEKHQEGHQVYLNKFIYH